MHICFLTLDYPTDTGGGGIGNQAQLLGQRLVKRGHRVSVITLMDQTGQGFWEDQGVAVHAVKSGSLHWYLSRIPWIGALLSLPVREIEYSLAAWKKVREIHQSTPIDLIEGSETGCLFSFCGKKPYVKLVRLHGDVFSFHKYTPGLSLGVGIRLSRLLQRHAMQSADFLVSPSHAHADEITQELKLAADTVQVIPNCLDLSAFMTLDAHNKSSWPIILFSGRLEKRKGVDLLIQAARGVIARWPDAHFLLAGAAHASLDLSPIKDEIKRDGLDKNILFLGHLPWDALLDYYYQANVFVLPSFYETFGIVALEAMASGTPVVGWRAGALPEVITDGVDGLLVAPGNVEGLSNAILDLLEHPGKVSRMGKAAREAAKAFDLETILEANIQMYEASLAYVD